MKSAIILSAVMITATALLMTIAKTHGMHPNFKALAFIAPASFVLVWAYRTIAISRPRIRQTKD